jgi:hypothetical protein
MLKRFQVLLMDWQAEYIKQVANHYDISFSEVIRIFISEGILSILFTLEPGKKKDISEKDWLDLKKNMRKPGLSEEDKHRIISKAYFEARKASEHLKKGLKPNK